MRAPFVLDETGARDVVERRSDDGFGDAAGRAAVFWRSLDGVLGPEPVHDEAQALARPTLGRILACRVGGAEVWRVREAQDGVVERFGHASPPGLLRVRHGGDSEGGED